MDLRAIAAAATPATTTTASGTETAAATTPATPATDAKKSFSALFTEAKKDLKTGEKLTHVKGHQFARIKGGERDDQCVNLSGNARNGEVFDLIWRGGHCFHVYGGTGADHVVVEVGTKAKTDTKTDTTPSSAAGGSSAA
jgi:hypothetical protein